MGEVTDEQINLAQREGHRQVPFEIAPDEAVVGDLQLQGDLDDLRSSKRGGPISRRS
jgi:hypothetical protein